MTRYRARVEFVDIEQLSDINELPPGVYDPWYDQRKKRWGAYLKTSFGEKLVYVGDYVITYPDGTHDTIDPIDIEVLYVRDEP